MTYGAGRGLKVKAFHSDEERSHLALEREINAWLTEHPDAEVIDIKFQHAIASGAVDAKGDLAAYPAWNHSALVVYREKAK